MDHRLTDTVLEQLATLSKLELTDTNKTELCKDLEQLLTYVDKISELSTDDTLPLTHFPETICRPDAENPVATTTPLQPGPKLREDIPCPDTHPEQLIALAPNQKDSYYIVPNSLHSD